MYDTPRLGVFTKVSASVPQLSLAVGLFKYLKVARSAKMTLGMRSGAAVKLPVFKLRCARHNWGGSEDVSGLSGGRKGDSQAAPLYGTLGVVVES